jgi:hypothetical protein
MIDILKRCVLGDLRRDELRGYVALEAALFWGTIFVAWNLYPAEHKYSIMTHTFSFLGSFDGEHNPQWWWVFSIAMYVWGLGNVPLVLYVYRRFATISAWGAMIGAFLFLAGCVGVVLVAAFPDARPEVIGHIRWTEIHEKAALLDAAGFTLGILWHGVLLLTDRFFGAGSRGTSCFNHRRLLWPYVFWVSVTGVAVRYLITWEHIYAKMKAAAAVSGAHIGSSWSEALNTRYSFPLWENVLIYTLYIFLAWFVLALPNDIAVTPPKAPASRG